MIRLLDQRLNVGRDRQRGVELDGRVGLPVPRPQAERLPVAGDLTRIGAERFERDVGKAGILLDVRRFGPLDVGAVDPERLLERPVCVGVAHISVCRVVPPVEDVRTADEWTAQFPAPDRVAADGSHTSGTHKPVGSRVRRQQPRPVGGSAPVPGGALFSAIVNTREE